MSDIAIQAQKISKAYVISADDASPRKRTLQEDIQKFLKGRKTKKKRFWALHDVSFEIKYGDVVGIIGGNGAGKSTLLKILSRITEPTSGYADIFGRVGSLLEVGTGFHTELTGRENVFLSGAVLGMTRAEIRKKCDEIVDFSGVEEFLDTPVKRFSSGMQVRLGFSVAAHLDPEILLIDEVLAVGDAEFQKKCLGKMDEISHGGRTVLFVSHNMSHVQSLCSNTILIEHGQISANGETEVVIEQYLSSVSSLRDTSTSLEDLPRRPGLGDHIRFSKCEIQTLECIVTNTLRFGQPFKIVLEINSSEYYSDLEMAIGFETLTRIRIHTAQSRDLQKYYNAEKGRTLKVQVQFDDLKLTPGSYYLSLYVRHDRKAIEAIERSIKFDVLDAFNPDFVPFTGAAGFIGTKPKWE